MKLFKLGEEAQPVNPKLVLPLPPPAPAAQPQQGQQHQQQPQANYLENQIVQWVNQHKNKLPTVLKNALVNPTQRAIVVAVIESLADPENHNFLSQFVQFTRQVASQKQFQNS
jgi:hypothetical protein